MSTRYYTFKRSARNFKEFGSARKFTVDTNLSYEEAQKRCEQWNNERSKAQIKRGTKLEFTAQ